MKKLLLAALVSGLVISGNAFGLFGCNPCRARTVTACPETCEPQPVCYKLVRKECPATKVCEKICHWVCPDGTTREEREEVC